MQEFKPFQSKNQLVLVKIQASKVSYDLSTVGFVLRSFGVP